MSVAVNTDGDTPQIDVTVAQGVSADQLDRAFDELANFSVRFEVPTFHLYELGADGVWRPEHEFELARRTAP